MKESHVKSRSDSKKNKAGKAEVMSGGDTKDESSGAVVRRTAEDEVDGVKGTSAVNEGENGEGGETVQRKERECSEVRENGSDGKKAEVVNGGQDSDPLMDYEETGAMRTVPPTRAPSVPASQISDFLASSDEGDHHTSPPKVRGAAEERNPDNAPSGSAERRKTSGSLGCRMVGSATNRVSQNRLHPLHPRYRCTNEEFSLGSSAIQSNCDWRNLSLHSVNNIKKIVTPNAEWTHRSATSLLDLVVRIEAGLSGRYLPEDQQVVLSSTWDPEPWTVASALQTAAQHCNHVSAALSLVRGGSTPREVIDAWKRRGVDWNEVERQLRRETFTPPRVLKDVLIVPKSWMSEVQKLEFPGDDFLPEGVVMFSDERDALSHHLETGTRFVYFVVDASLGKEETIDQIDAFNRCLSRNHERHGYGIVGILLSMPVMATDAYIQFHESFVHWFEEWRQAEEESNRSICVRNHLYDGSEETHIKSYYMRNGILNDYKYVGMRLHEIETYCFGLKAYFRSIQVPSVFENMARKGGSGVSPLKRRREDGPSFARGGSSSSFRGGSALSSTRGVSSSRPFSQSFRSRGGHSSRGDHLRPPAAVSSRGGQWNSSVRGRGSRVFPRRSLY